MMIMTEKMMMLVVVLTYLKVDVMNMFYNCSVNQVTK